MTAIGAFPDKQGTVPDPVFEFRVKGGIDALTDFYLRLLSAMATVCDVTGSRVMGGGFGGCTINLVKEELYDAFIKTATEKFTEKFGHAPKIYNVVISDGARKL